MKREDINKARLGLAEAIANWWENADITVPLVGDDLYEIMAEASLQVLVGIANTQEYLKSEDLLKEDD